MSDVKSTRRLPYNSDADSALASEFRYVPRINPLEAARRHWWLVVLPVVIIVAVVGWVADHKTPTYSAEARMIVGRLNISEPGAIQGYATAAQDLAQTYPLTLDASGVVYPLAHEFRMTPTQIRNSMSATEVPSSSIIRLDTSAKSAHLAISLANAATNQMVSYLAATNQDDPDVSRLFAQMQAAELNAQKTQAALVAATPAPPAHGPTPPLPPAAQKAAAAADVAKVQLDAATRNYEDTAQSETVSSLLQPIVYADTASSNHKSTLEISLFGALVAGLVIGIALATIRANRVVRRALVLPAWEPEATDAPIDERFDS